MRLALMHPNIFFKVVDIERYIQENYSKICDVERELANFSLQMKLTAGPKKADIAATSHKGGLEAIAVCAS
ncbi:hypothetical protein JHK87_055769 [Glycine soja]|nr:hypothetical protein JHK87_055769 [Glycine soja]